MAFSIEGMSIFSGMTGTMVTTIMFCVVALVFLGILGAAAWWWKTRKRYDIKVRIYSTRYGSPKTWDDWGAIYKDAKTGQANGFKLKSEKEVISPPDYALMMMSTKGNVIHMRQDATGHFSFIRPDFEGEAKFKVVPEDVRLWQSAARDKADILYSKKPWWKDLLAFMPFVICAILIIIMIYVVLQKFEVLKEVSANLAQAAASLKDLHASGALVTVGA